MLNGHSSFIIVEMLLLLPLQKFFTLVSLHPIIIFHLNISWRWFFLSILQWIKFWLKYNLLLLKPHTHTRTHVYSSALKVYTDKWRKKQQQIDDIHLHRFLFSFVLDKMSNMRRSITWVWLWRYLLKWYIIQMCPVLVIYTAFKLTVLLCFFHFQCTNVGNINSFWQP